MDDCLDIHLRIKDFSETEESVSQNETNINLENMNKTYLNINLCYPPDNEIYRPKSLNLEDNLEKIAKENLIFEYKSVNIFRFYFHVSYICEYILMIIGILMSLVSGAALPIMAYLTGSTTNEASHSSNSNLNIMKEKEKQIFYEEFKDNMHDKVKQFLLFGFLTFLSHFLSNFTLQYASFRQIHNLKEKYFSKIL